MVQIVRDSEEYQSYREVNIQLAKENAELRQQLSVITQNKADQYEEILSLRLQVSELKRKIDAVREIVLLDHTIHPLAIEGPCQSDDGERRKDLTAILVHDRAAPWTLDPITECSRSDSLDLSSTSSVPPFRHADSDSSTPSVVHCLDSPVRDSTRPTSHNITSTPLKVEDETILTPEPPRRYNLRKRKA